jgi:XTP/dITP diphosphohydrolase
VRLVLATRNEHKAREFAVLLAPHEIVALPAGVTLPPETGDTFAANALDVPVIADDSGIVSEALDGRPGVYSARFAGPDATDAENLAKLLAEAPAGSALAYVCALVYVDPTDGTAIPFEGRCTGVLDDRPRGDGGFGYDPAFRPDDIADGRTMAELTPEEKAAISHRGRAARELGAWLASR